MKEYTVDTPKFDNTLKCFKAEDREELEDKLRSEGIEAYEVVSEKEV